MSVISTENDCPFLLENTSTLWLNLTKEIIHAAHTPVMPLTLSLASVRSGQVMLVDEACQGTFSRVFDIQSSDLSLEDCESRQRPHEGRFPVNVGISGRVATTGRVRATSRT